MKGIVGLNPFIQDVNWKLVNSSITESGIFQQKEKQMSIDTSHIFDIDGYEPKVKTKQDTEIKYGMDSWDKKSLAKITDSEEIRRRAKGYFDLVLSHIEDPNVKGFIANQCYIAGGCIRNIIMGIPINDIDIYFRTTEYAEIFKNLYQQRKYSDKQIFTNDVRCIADTYNALTFKSTVSLPFQFVVKTGGEPALVVFDTFDFENCMGWYDPVSDTIDISIMMRSLNSGKLVYNSKSTNPLNSIKRLIKFQKMGFQITEKCLFDMFKQSKEHTNPEQFKSYKLNTPAEY